MRPRPKRIVGIDYGMARIGIALSDERQIIASPLLVHPTSRKLEKTVASLLELFKKHQDEWHYEISEIIVGFPLLLNNKVGHMADEVNLFVAKLKAALPDCPITLFDERLTTMQAERALRESTLSRRQRSALVDKVSAALILQNYLDRRSSL